MPRPTMRISNNELQKEFKEKYTETYEPLNKEVSNERFCSLKNMLKNLHN